jgi:hypothetical protein
MRFREIGDSRADAVLKGVHPLRHHPKVVRVDALPIATGVISYQTVWLAMHRNSCMEP